MIKHQYATRAWIIRRADEDTAPEDGTIVTSVDTYAAARAWIETLGDDVLWQADDQEDGITVEREEDGTYCTYVAYPLDV